MESKFVEADGVRMRWEETGEGPPVVFVHGIPTSPRLWRHVVPKVDYYEPEPRSGPRPERFDSERTRQRMRGGLTVLGEGRLGTGEHRLRERNGLRRRQRGLGRSRAADRGQEPPVTSGSASG